MQTEHLTPEEAVNYLIRTYGIRYSPKYFAKLRHTGDGAEHVKFPARVYYTPEQLDEWVQSRRQVRRTTSEPSVLTASDKAETPSIPSRRSNRKPAKRPSVKPEIEISRDLDVFELLSKFQELGADEIAK